MGSREERLLSEQLQRMADLGVEPVALPPVGDGPAEEIAEAVAYDLEGERLVLAPGQEERAWSPGDIAEPAPPPCDVGPIPDLYIGLRNGSTGPADEPAVTPAEERMIFGAPINRTVAEVGAVLTPAEIADAEAAGGAIAAETIGVLRDSIADSPIRIEDCADPEPDPDFAEVEEDGPNWVIGDLCVHNEHLAEILDFTDDGATIDVWDVALKKGGYEWSDKVRWGIDPLALRQIETDAAKLYADAFRQHRAARAAESAAREAAYASDRLLRAHYALAEAVGALALVGKAVKVADAESTAA